MAGAADEDEVGKGLGFSAGVGVGSVSVQAKVARASRLSRQTVTSRLIAGLRC